MSSLVTVISDSMPRRLSRLLATDTFTRSAAVGDGIGSADRGGTWTLSGTSLVSINGSQLVLDFPAGSNRHFTLDTNVVDSDTYIEWQCDTATVSGTLTVALLARSISSLEQIRGKLTVDSTNTIKVQGYTICPLSGSETPGNVNPGSAAETSIATGVTVTRLGTFALNTKYWLRMQTKLTVVRLKVWLASQSEPTAWDWTGTQTIINIAGDNGGRALSPSGNAAIIKLDNFRTRSTTGYTTLLPASDPAVFSGGSLQTAVDDDVTYPNGSTIIVADGDFDEAITIPADRVLVIRAENDGGVRVRGSQTADITSGWTQVGATPVYQCTVAHVVHGVMVSGRPLLKFTSLANLTNSFFGDGSTVAPPEGFFSQAGTLYVRLEGGGSPNGTNITITRSGITSSAGTAFTIPSTSSLTIEGITIEQWPHRAIFVNESATVIMRRVWFHNCYIGVQDPDTLNVPTSHIRFEYCTYNMSGTSGTYNGPWSIRKALGESSQGTSGNPDGLYESNFGGKLCKVTCDDIQVWRCYIHDCFDCTEIKGRYTTSDYGLAGRTSYIRENLMQRFCDNGPEVEPANRFTYMEVDHNVLLDGYVSIAMAPFMAGQIDVYNNIIYISEDWLADSGTTVGTAIKHSGTSAFPGMVPEYPGSTPGGALTVQKNIHVYHNTFIMGRSATQWARPVTADEASFTFEGTYYRDNITIHYKSREWELGGYELSRYNLMWHGGTATEFNLNHYKHPSIGGTTSIWTGTAYETRPTTAPLSSNPLLGTTNSTRFNLQSGSPCIGAASDGGDLGAVPFGTSWTMPSVGVDWAAATATNAAVPASLDPAIIGL